MPGTDTPNSRDEISASTPREDGLPAVTPDWVEQDHPEEIDNIVPTHSYDMLPVVGLGGSAGSIPALQHFFEKMPAESGMAFVVIIHLAPEHESILAEMLARATAMRVVQAADGQKLVANTVYVIPPGKHLTLGGGRVRLTPVEPARGTRVAVDVFLRSLADSHGAHARAIILSGADGDGVLGIKRVKERGGLTVAQAPEEAEHPSMPRSAIETGMVDWVLRVEEMPARLLQYHGNEPRLQLPSEDGPQPATVPMGAADADEAALREVLAFLRTRTGRDFSYYKRATVVRRISRRMQVNNALTVAEYLGFLRTHPGEAGALLQDLLISVTNFFRDRDAFAALEAEIPSIFVGKEGGSTIRAWVAACATGEEAYSVAMLLIEQASRMSSPPSIQVFATDLDENAIVIARHGLFPFAMEADVSEERLRRFFVKEHRGYRARRELRECVLFATHDLLKDSPFSRMDLVTCRNLLIYLTREAQARALEIFHFALKPYGLLFLGNSESIEDESRRFATVDKKHRVFRQKETPRGIITVPGGPATMMARLTDVQEHARSGAQVFAKAFGTPVAAGFNREAESGDRHRASWEELHFKLIERYAPPSLIVTRDYDIVHVSETAGRFLQMRGAPSVNLLQVVHPSLRIELRAALFRAAQTGVPAESFRVPVEIEGKTVAVDIRVAPAQEIAPDHLLVVFAVREVSESEREQLRVEAEPAVRHLERENEQLKSRMRDMMEQYEASLEESKLSNEELQAMNEELRSAGEELETGREELQSVNEELTTVNHELKSKVDELALSNSDLSNLMAAAGVATIFLDRTLRIKRYTPSAVELFRLIPSDIERPLTDLTHGLDYPDLRFDAERVLHTFVPVKREVGKDDGRWFLAQLLPYRTTDDRIMGVVLSFVDITEARQAQQALQASETRLRLAVDTASLAVFDWDLRTDRVEACVRFRKLFGLGDDEEIIGWNLLSEGIHPEDRAIVEAELRRTMECVSGTRYEFEFRAVLPDGTERWMLTHGQVICEGEGVAQHAVRVLGTGMDITERKLAEMALRKSEAQIAADLAGMRRLYDLHARLAEQDDLKAALEDVLAVACEFTGTDRGCVQLLSRDGERLEMFAWHGYADDSPFISVFRYEGFDKGCEVARVERQRLIIEETVGFPGLGDTEAGDAVRAEGIRAAQSTPMTSRSEEVLGVLSTQFRQPRRPDDHELRLVDMLAWTAAEYIDRHRADMARRESEERLRFAMEAASLYAWEFDVETGRAAFASSTEPVLGFVMPEAVDETVALIHPEDRAMVVENYDRARREEDRFDAEFRFVHPQTGAVVWQSSHGIFLKRADGVSRFVGITQNITARRRAEEALRATEEQFRRAIQDAPIPVIMHTEDGQVLQLSRAWMELTGYTHEDLPTIEDWFTRAYAGRAEQARENVRRVFSGELRLSDLEVSVTTRSGEERLWSFSASAPGTLRDGRRFLVGMAVDITGRKRVEAALRESQERMRLIVENAREYAIFSQDLTRRITSWNSGSQAILGYAEEEAVGQSGDIIFTPEDRANRDPEREAGTALQEGRAANERWHVKKDGTRFWGSGVMTTMSNAQGEAVGFVKIFRDQTKELLAKMALEQSREELWAALQETERARAEAEAASRAKDHFLAVLSHELRTPLTPVVMAVRTLARDPNLSAKAREALAMIQRNVTLEAHLIDDLLDVTRISRGKLELVREPLDLHEAIRGAVEVSRTDIEAKGQQLSVELGASEHRLEGDPKRFQQVFWNLLKNASKFTPEGGQITLRSRNEPGRIVVELRDTGIGFEPEAGQRIFAAFEQASQAVTREFGGLGLGLAISKATVDAHGGSIRAESAGRDQGATFSVDLPLESEKDGPSAPVEPASAES